MRKLPPPKCIAVDVDGTLIGKFNLPNEKLISWCKFQKSQGFYLILWSARGRDHAVKTAESYRCLELWDVIMSKPGYIVDDKGWNWVKYTKVLNNLPDTKFAIDDNDNN